jgi:hypothetical protein
MLVLHRLWSFLLVAIASSLMISAAVHAREIPMQGMIECSGAVHSDGDADQSSGDSDKGMPHHHGTCHAQPLDLRAAGELTSVSRQADLRPFAARDEAIASRLVDPALRPPAA